MIPCTYMHIYAIHRIRNNVSSFVRKMSRRKDFSMEKPSARGLKMLFNFFQHALVARNTTLAWLLFKARRSKRREKMCESMITRGIMRVGVWKVSKCISAESNGANIFRNVHVRWGCRRDAPTDVHGLSLSVVFALFEWDAVCAFLVSSLNIFLLPRQIEIYGSDDATRCMPRLRFHLHIRWLKSGTFTRPLKSLQFKAHRADFRFFYVVSVKSTQSLPMLHA